MDKYEIKVKIDEIKDLIKIGEYKEAVEIADTVDWTRVKSKMALSMVSEVYKINRRFEDSKELLLLAYDKYSKGRSVLYSLCELCIKMGQMDEAMKFYTEFIDVARNDNSRYILQYKLYTAKGASVEKRIEVLEAYRKREYRDKWFYELAYLYHSIGLATQCIEVCDELVLWFGEGEYVIKALELKMIHKPLTADQQKIYDNRFGEKKEMEEVVEEPKQEDVVAEEEFDIQIQTMDVHNEYSTINLQKELAENMQEYISVEENMSESPVQIDSRSEADTFEQQEVPEKQEDVVTSDTIIMNRRINDVNVITQDTIVVADKELKEIRERIINEPEAEVFFGETGEIDLTGSMIMEQLKEEHLKSEAENKGNLDNDNKSEITDEQGESVVEVANREKMQVAVEDAPQGEMAKLFQMEYDGQIKLVVPNEEKVDKQITGQISISDVLLEWEKVKKENAAANDESVRLRILEQTGEMFNEFDELVRDSILRKMQKGEKIDETDPCKDKKVEEKKEEAKVEDEIQETEVEEEIQETEVEEEIKEAEEEIKEAEVEEEIEETEVEEEIQETEVEEEIQETEVEEEIEETEVEEEIQEAEVEEEIQETEVEEEIQEAEVEEEIQETEVEEEIEEAEVEEEIEERKSSRSLTKDEQKEFGPYLQGKESKKQFVTAFENISLAAYTGNLIITGDAGTNTFGLIKKMIKHTQQNDTNFSGGIIKISAEQLNKKGSIKVLEKVANGALIIMQASKLSEEFTKSLMKALDKEDFGVIVILEDTAKAMNKLINKMPKVTEYFNARFDIKSLDDTLLEEYGCKYANEQEYVIDDLGKLALHTRISDMQTSDHNVTMEDVRAIVDEAIYYANKKSVGHFFDILVGKRYNEEDMIILREKDFM